jgi:hypothetical protein
MKGNNSDQDSHSIHSSSSKSSYEHDTTTCTDSNLEQNPGLHYLTSNSNNRRPTTKRTTHAITPHNESDGNGLVINGKFFDGQLFQPARSSCILDYSDTPKDLNRFIAGHNISSKSSNLDKNLFKLSFVITLSEWQFDKEHVLDYHMTRIKHVVWKISRIIKDFVFRK